MGPFVKMLVVLVVLAWAAPAAAAVTIATPFNFREHLGPNTIGSTPGDWLIFGVVTVQPSGSPTAVTATQGAVAATLNFRPSTLFPDLYFASVPFDAALVIGDVKVADSLWEQHRPQFRRSIEEWYKRNGGFESVLAKRPAQVPADSVVLLSSITEVDKGSAALRWIIGMGAGQAKVKGDFEIQDPGGTTLARFSAQESYLGGAGIGGAGFLDMDDLFRRFAETVAETTRKWARGEKIEER